MSVTSYIKCEDVRSISVNRLRQRLGAVNDNTLDEIEMRLRIILALDDDRPSPIQPPIPARRRFVGRAFCVKCLMEVSTDVD